MSNIKIISIIKSSRLFFIKEFALIIRDINVVMVTSTKGITNGAIRLLFSKNKVTSSLKSMLLAFDLMLQK